MKYVIDNQRCNYDAIVSYFFIYFLVDLLCMNENKSYLSLKVVYVRYNLITLDFLICFHETNILIHVAKDSCMFQINTVCKAEINCIKKKRK